MNAYFYANANASVNASNNANTTTSATTRRVGGRLQGNYDEMAPAGRVLSVGKTIALFLKTRRTFRGVSGEICMKVRRTFEGNDTTRKCARLDCLAHRGP